MCRADVDNGFYRSPGMAYVTRFIAKFGQLTSESAPGNAGQGEMTAQIQNAGHAGASLKKTLQVFNPFRFCMINARFEEHYA